MHERPRKSLENFTHKPVHPTPPTPPTPHTTRVGRGAHGVNVMATTRRENCCAVPRPDVDGDVLKLAIRFPMLAMLTRIHRCADSTSCQSEERLFGTGAVDGAVFVAQY